MNEAMKTAAGIHAGRAAQHIVQAVCQQWPAEKQRRLLFEEFYGLIFQEMDRLVLALEKGGGK